MSKVLTAVMMSAVKRKNVKDMVAIMLAFDGNAEGAEMVQGATRLTEKLMKDAGCYAYGDEPDYEEIKEEYAEEECCPTEEINTEDPFKLNELDTLIAQGKKKKAKKLLKEIEATGLKGSELKKRKALVKEL